MAVGLSQRVFNPAAFVGGLVLGTANTVRHRVQGYVTPRSLSSEEVDRVCWYVDKMVRVWTEVGGLDPAGKRILELGPGPDHGTGVLLLARGAASYTAIDLFELTGQAHPELYRRLGERHGFDGEALRRRVDYRLVTYPDIPQVDGPFDAFVSSGALEHFDDVPGTFRRLRELAAPGAVMCHYIDAFTHMRGVRQKDPLNVYRYPAWLYRSLLSFPGAPNRLLVSDYVRAAEQAGFTDVRIRKNQEEPVSPEYVDRVRRSLARGFRDRDPEELGTLMFVLTAVAPS